MRCDASPVARSSGGSCRIWRKQKVERLTLSNAVLPGLLARSWAVRGIASYFDEDQVVSANCPPVEMADRLEGFRAWNASREWAGNAGSK